MSALRISALRVELPVAEGMLQAVRGIDLAIDAGEMLCLVGESGSGKSLTALAAMGLLPRTARVSADALEVTGQDMRNAVEPAWRGGGGGQAAMIFQDPTTSLDPVWSIGEQMIEGFRKHRPGVGRADALSRAEQMLARTGIDRPRMRLAQYPHELSGGMRQRVMIAAALMTEPKLLIADEPTTALDAQVQAQILALLAALKRDLGLGILLITHDLSIAARHADRVAVMYAGEIVESGPRETVFAAPWHPYTRALLACRPGGTPTAGIAGVVPGLAPPPEGCAFRARCTLAIEACALAVAPVAKGARMIRCVRGGEAAPAATPEVPTRQSRAASAEPAFVLQDVSVRFAGGGMFRRGGGTQALLGVSLSVPRGGVLGIVGESGSGKSTLARVLLGLQAPDAGRVSLFGRELAGIGRSGFARRGFARMVQPVFQDPYSSLNPRRLVGEIIRLPLDVHGIGASAERPAMVRAMMERCGLAWRLAQARPAQLSGGQRQRVAIATALVMRPDVVVCDEPTSALDVSVQAQILALLVELRQEFGLTYVFISHDLAVVRSLADTVAVMRAGEVVEQGAAEAVFTSPRHAYTAALLEAA